MVAYAAQNESAPRAGNTKSAPIQTAAKAISQNHDDRITDATPMQSPIRLTPLRLKALLAAHDDSLHYPGRFLQPRPGLARPYADLARAGLLEVTTDRPIYGRYHRTYAPRRYRLTDAGRETCRAALPAVRLPIPPAMPQRPRHLQAHELRDIKAALTNGWRDMRLALHPDGTALTLWARLIPSDREQYSPTAFAADLTTFILKAMPRAAVTATATYPARPFPGDEHRAAGLKSGSLASTETIQMIRNVRRVAWVSITFHLQEDIPLLCAGQGGPSLLTIAPAAPVASVWPVALVPEEITPQMIWDDLTVEAQALLVALSGQRGWQPVRGASDSDLRGLDHELLIFWQRQLREARITARGLDLVEAMVSVEAAL